MLTRSTVLAFLTVAAGLFVGAQVPAMADGGKCTRSANPWCSTERSGPGSSAGNGGTGGGSGCTWQGQIVPCADPDYGSYVGGGCYWRAYDPQPLHAPPNGQDPNKGKWGVMSCYTGPGSGVVTQVNRWMAEPETGPSPAELAQQALANIHLLGARIGIAPRPNGSGAVGLPVWLWTAVTPGTWGPLSASASAGGITVTIEANASQILWDMGDGHQKICTNPGTPYQAKYGFAQSPTCGHVYTRPSVTATNPNGRFRITATTHWTVTWSGGGESGVLTPTSQSQTSVRIGEIPVVGQ